MKLAELAQSLWGINRNGRVGVHKSAGRTAYEPRANQRNSTGDMAGGSLAGGWSRSATVGSREPAGLGFGTTMDDEVLESGIDGPGAALGLTTTAAEQSAPREAEQIEQRA